MYAPIFTPCGSGPKQTLIQQYRGIVYFCMTQTSTHMTAGKRLFSQPLTETNWFNAIWFQTTWFCAVLGRESFLPLTAALIVLHLVLVPDRGKEIRQLAAVAAVGIGVDAFLSASGVFIFTNDALIPLWLIGLWLAFATTFTRSLSFLASRPLLAALAGAIVVPFNYGVGARLGAVEFGYSLPVAFGVMAAIWAILLPSLYFAVSSINTMSDKENSDG
jgi:hypothetical protein